MITGITSDGKKIIIQREEEIASGKLVVDLRPANLLEARVVETYTEHGEQYGAPDTEVTILELPDGSRVRRSCSRSEGEMGLLFSGYWERKL